MNTVFCFDCGAEINIIGSSIGENNEFYCHSCYDKNHCVECGLFVSDENKVIYNATTYCLDCFGDNFSLCDGCGELCPRNEVHLIGVEVFCDDCCVQCGACGNMVSRHDGLETYNDNLVCADCFDTHYFHCSECDEVYHLDDYGGDGLCQGCYDDRQDEQDGFDGLYPYSYKPTPLFHGKGTEYMGVELEVDDPQTRIDFQEIVDNLPSWTYCKEDGSLSRGFEVVTHPATWEHWQRWKKTWDTNVLAYLSSVGFQSYNTTTCGLHIHISSETFSTLHLYRFLKLFYEYPEFTLLVSSRKKAALDAWASLDDDGNITYKCKLKKEGKAAQLRKYSAVNLSPENTVEVRIFRGTLSPKGFWKDMEFVKAAIEFTREESITNITASNLMRYVGVHKKLYPNLFDFLDIKIGLGRDNLAIYESQERTQSETLKREKKQKTIEEEVATYFTCLYCHLVRLTGIDRARDYVDADTFLCYFGTPLRLYSVSHVLWANREYIIRTQKALDEMVEIDEQLAVLFHINLENQDICGQLLSFYLSEEMDINVEWEDLYVHNSL